MTDEQLAEVLAEPFGSYRIADVGTGFSFIPDGYSATARYLAREMRKVLDDAKGVVSKREDVAFLAWKGLVGRVEGWLGERLDLEP